MRGVTWRNQSRFTDPGAAGAVIDELPADLAALPGGFAAIAHQILERGFPRKKGVVLTQIAQPQTGMADNLPAIEFFLAEQDAEQRALPGPIAADEPDLCLIADDGVCVFKQHLAAVALGRFGDLNKGGHARWFCERINQK